MAGLRVGGMEGVVTEHGEVACSAARKYMR